MIVLMLCDYHETWFSTRQRQRSPVYIAVGVRLVNQPLAGGAEAGGDSSSLSVWKRKQSAIRRKGWLAFLQVGRASAGSATAA